MKEKSEPMVGRNQNRDFLVSSVPSTNSPKITRSQLKTNSTGASVSHNNSSGKSSISLPSLHRKTKVATKKKRKTKIPSHSFDHSLKSKVRISILTSSSQDVITNPLLPFVRRDQSKKKRKRTKRSTGQNINESEENKLEINEYIELFSSFKETKNISTWCNEIEKRILLENETRRKYIIRNIYHHCGFSFLLHFLQYSKLIYSKPNEICCVIKLIQIVRNNNVIIK